jgi:hypothetical protein
MGKKKHLKVLKQIAGELPEIHTSANGGEILIAINHQRRMRKMFIRHGAAGVNSYINAVKNSGGVV